MKTVKEIIKFEWDKGNIEKNKKHDVEDKESEEPFFDKNNIILEDEKHSAQEERYLLLGRSKKKRELSIIFTIRKNNVRIISARDMNKKERNKYEKGI